MFVNLTPHAVNIITADGVLTVAPSGMLARVSESLSQICLVGGVSICRQMLGDVQGLPAQADGVAFIVSAMVRSAVPHRTDVFSPADFVRDGDGKITGCKCLVCN